MYVPPPLELPTLTLAQAKPKVIAVVTHYYADSMPGTEVEIVKAFEVGNKQRVKAFIGINRSGQKLFKQYPLNVLSLKA